MVSSVVLNKPRHCSCAISWLPRALFNSFAFVALGESIALLFPLRSCIGTCESSGRWSGRWGCPKLQQGKADLLRHTKGFAPSPLAQSSNRLFAGVWHRGRTVLGFQSSLWKEKGMPKECEALARPEQL